MMLKEQYCHMIAQCTPKEQVVQRVLQGARAEKRRCRLRPRAAVAAAVLACVLLATPVMAAAVEPFRAALYAVSPATAQYFTPVQKSCEDNGIRMEVVASYIHGDTAELYVTMQDLAGDRIDETIDLFDSCDILCPYDSSATCALVDYEEATRTATFLVTITEWGNHKIEGSKITFTVREFLSHKQFYEGVEIDVDLADLAPAATMQPTDVTGWSGRNSEKEADLVLQPGAPVKGFPVRGVDVTGVGSINGKLHVQTAVRDLLEYDNHGFVYLADETGARVDGDNTIHFCMVSDSGERVDYQETIFSVPESEIGKYTLRGDFVTCDTKTTGNWRVTFPLTNMEL